MKRLFLIALAVVVALFVVANVLALYNIRTFSFLILSEDEPPIIVKNGTMDIDASPGWHWKSENAKPGQDKRFSYQPNLVDFQTTDPGIWVNVTTSTGTCSGAQMPFQASEVRVGFSENSYTAVFTRRKGLVNWRINVSPGQNLEPPTGGVSLHYGSATGYITSVSANGAGGPLQCTFSEKEAQLRIRLCRTAQKCQ